ncbi:hypothetical protein RSOLAG22IIIB_06640 [Rhizoctonia solani]|uniref:Uncharacterized protein n=1 Tax=Rhizoctonia solani TaxID=456999 RepID=A0A0K6GFB7_9AGAM|nr:hypothetical protein RSOLAG22IIIB_06640 [Rhizoctonia solani]
MSLIHHQITTQSEPLPPIICPPKAKEVIPPLEKFTSSVDTWLDHGAPDRLRLEGIRFKEFERILQDLYSRGLKPRYDWDQKSRTAVLKMPTNIHEKVGAFFAFEVTTLINQFLEYLSICGYPSVAPTGSPSLPIGENGSTVCPDQGLCLRQRDADGQRVYVQDTPRVIVETAVSETRSHVMAKVLSCLHEIPGLQAAVVCDMKNIPPRTVHGAKSSSKAARPFLAEIAVWTRKTVGPLDPDPCYHREELGDHKLGDTVGFTGSLVLDQSHINSSSPVAGDGFNECAREYFREDPRYPHQLQSIIRRSEDWITIYNSGTPIVRGEPEPELVFDVYDFLRPCSRFPQSYISDRKISIPLGDLRRELVLALQARQKLSLPKAGSLTRGFGPSQGLHRRKGQLSSITTHPIGMKFRRGLFTSSTSPLLGNRSARCWTAVRPMATRPSVPLFARLLVPGAVTRVLSRFIRR